MAEENVQCDRPDEVTRKPPPEIEPRVVHESCRAQDILDAMRGYSEAGMVIPLEWIDELHDLGVSIYKLRKRKK